MTLSALLTAVKLMKHRGGLALMGDLRTQVRLNFLFAAFETGLLSALRAPHSRQELAALLSVKREDLLDALLDVGVSTGELRVREGIYRIAGRRSQAMLHAQGDMFVAMVQAYATYYNSLYRELPARMRGGPLGSQLEHIGDLVARASQISDPFLCNFVKRAAGRGARRVMEIGCGSGAHLRTAARANPALCGLGLDLDPVVVSRARRTSRSPVEPGAMSVSWVSVRRSFSQLTSTRTSCRPGATSRTFSRRPSRTLIATTLLDMDA